MSKQQKLIDKLKRKPRNFTFDEAEALLYGLGFQRAKLGKTSGSRVAYKLDNYSDIRMHKPHPQKELKSYQILDLLKQLEKEGLI